MQISRLPILIIALALVLFSCTKDDDGAGSDKIDDNFSVYITSYDSTRLAATIWLPGNESDVSYPTLVVLTRYGRERDVEFKNFFLSNDYAIVSVDVRGTGASFGIRPGEYSPPEVKDGYSIADWIIKQSWSDGNLGAYGLSYSGTTAELFAASGHPAIKAVIPGWSDFDIYDSPARPYGMTAAGFLQQWSDFVYMQDNNLDGSAVAVDDQKSLLESAVLEHAKNPIVVNSVNDALYKDSKIAEYSYYESSPIYWEEEIEASNIPMLVFSSWMDSGLSEGTLYRLQYFNNPQKVIISADNHGGQSHASPYKVGSSEKQPSIPIDEMKQMRLDFFDTYLKGDDKGINNWPLLKYYNMGEETYNETDVWPIESTRKKIYLDTDNGLNFEQAEVTSGNDSYKVDFTATTGSKNRWFTQLGEPILNLNEREKQSDKLLTYTSALLTEDIQITGTPYVDFTISATHSDGLLLCYLEDVDPNGNSRYITEGGLRLIHHLESENVSNIEGLPYHSFNKDDAKDFPIATKTNVRFKMIPTSVLIKSGNRIRITIAGADADIFDNIPASRDMTYKFYHGQDEGSFISLPVVD